MLTFQKQHAQEMTAHGLEQYPNECCGILAGKSQYVSHVYRITNTARSPFRYLMDSQELLAADRDSERNGWEFLAFYHSHTHSPAYPSQTDVRMALQSGWLDICYVLLSLEDKASLQLRTFRIGEDGGIVDEEHQIA